MSFAPNVKTISYSCRNGYLKLYLVFWGFLLLARIVSLIEGASAGYNRVEYQCFNVCVMAAFRSAASF